jgi:hypothetical protein
VTNLITNTNNKFLHYVFCFTKYQSGIYICFAHTIQVIYNNYSFSLAIKTIMIIVVQYDDRPISQIPVLHKLMQINADFCHRNNMVYHYYNSYYKDMPCYWIKIFLLRDIMLHQAQDGDYVVWLDSDAFIHKDFTPYLPNIDKNQVMTISPDINPILSPFCAGVFIANRQSLPLFNLWTTFYNQNRWYKKKGKWTTKARWAGKNYEQGSFVHYILPHYKDHIRTVPSLILQCPKLHYLRNTTCIFHFSWGNKEKRIEDTLSKLHYN